MDLFSGTILAIALCFIKNNSRPSSYLPNSYLEWMHAGFAVALLKIPDCSSLPVAKNNDDDDDDDDGDASRKRGGYSS
jgi:hypothetical protein